MLSKCQNGDRSSKIFRDLHGAISRNQVFVWCRMIDATGSINVSASTGPPRVIRTKNLIQKVRSRLKCKRKVSSRKMAQDFNVSRTTVGRILKEDLGCYAYKKRIEPKFEKQ